MPLIEGCSENAVLTNYKKLRGEGYKEDQAWAIAYSVAHDNIKKCSVSRQRELKKRKN